MAARVTTFGDGESVWGLTSARDSDPTGALAPLPSSGALERGSDLRTGNPKGCPNSKMVRGALCSVCVDDPRTLQVGGHARRREDIVSSPPHLRAAARSSATPDAWQTGGADVLPRAVIAWCDHLCAECAERDPNPHADNPRNLRQGAPSPGRPKGGSPSLLPEPDRRLLGCRRIGVESREAKRNCRGHRDDLRRARHDPSPVRPSTQRGRS
jgi:hypothetical protein